MDLTFTPEEQAFREEVRRFVREKLPESIRHKVVNSLRLSREDHVLWQRTLHERGWGGPGWPKEHGGPGWNAVEQYIFEEECAAAGAPRLIAFGIKMVAPVIMAFGSPEQQRRFLPDISAARKWWCQGYSEPGSGSDLASLKTRAVRGLDAQGDHFVVNGQKTWTTLGQYADWIFCLVRTDPQAKAQRGISFLLIDMKSPGITVRPIITLDGAHEVNEVWFEDVRVPAENLIGEENKGWTYAKFLLGHERSNIAGIGISKRELARLKRVAATEKKRGRPLIEDPIFSAKIAQLEVDLLALEMTNLRVLSDEKNEKAPDPAASILKIRGTEIQQAITELLVQAVGPYALPFVREAIGSSYDGDHIGPAYAAPLGAHYCNMRKLSIFGGSNEIQKNIISQQLLGLSTMDFSFSEEQQQLQDAVTRFVQGDYTFERRHKIVKSVEGWSREAWQGLADLGVLAMNIPEDQGGLGYGPIETMLAMQSTGPALLCEPLLDSGVIATALVRDFATTEQRAALLRAMGSGERILVLAHFEPPSRGEAAWVEASAEPAGDGFVLNGHKAVVALAPAADELLVTARVAGGPSDAQGVSLFRVPRDAAGLVLQAYPTLDGRRAAEVILKHVKVPASALVGAAGAALPAVGRALDIGLAALCGEALGVMEATVAATLEYLKTRQQFGQPIGRFQALQHRTADMLMHLEQSRSMTYLAAMNCRLDDDLLRRKTLSAAKVVVGNACRFIGQQSVQLHGGMGMTEELNVSHFFKRLMAIELSLGDTDTHLQRFAELTQRDIPLAA